MAKKPRNKDGGDFSVIFGARKFAAEEGNAGSSGKKGRPGPEPEEVHAERKPPKRESLDDLLKKKGELELFLTSMEDATLDSRLPQYSYDRLKKKSKLEIKRIGQKISNMGYGDVRREGEKLDRHISGIRNAIDSLKNERIIDTDYNQKGRWVNVKFEELESRLNELSRNLRQVSEKLGQRIEEVAVTDDVEITENVRELKKEIDSIRSSLSEFVRRGDLQNLIPVPAAGTRKTPGGLQEFRAKKGKTVHIKDLPGFAGKEVAVKCMVEPFKSIEKAKEKVYWYRIEDETGRSILTSYEKLKAGKAVIAGTVRKTGSGSYYLLYRGPA